MGRTFEDVHKGGSVTVKLEDAMRKAGDDEWDEFKRIINLEPIKDKEAERIIADGSGLVRGTGFEDWVLGKTEKPIDPETIIRKVKTLGKEA